jgi:hypothetical protein
MDSAASAAAIVPGPILVFSEALKRVATRGTFPFWLAKSSSREWDR